MSRAANDCSKNPRAPIVSEGRQPTAALKRSAIHPGGNHDEFERENERESKEAGQKAR
jgi:hypothetical protein